MEPQKPNAKTDSETPTASSPVVAPTEAPLAEPPKEAIFTEVPDEVAVEQTDSTQPQPTGVVIADPAEADATTAPLATPPAKSKKTSDGPKKPVLAIALAVVLFVVLAGLAYYAYSKTT